jgi:hypothetical protein
MIYKIEGQNGVKILFYVKADSVESAYERICDVSGEVPRNAMKITLVKEIPKGSDVI